MSKGVVVEYMNTLYIRYPYANIIFKISIDDINLYKYLKIYFGTAVSKNNNETDVQIYHINILYLQNKIETGYNNQYESVTIDNNNILYKVFMIIRSNLTFKESWNAYHGTVVHMNEKNYLFMGESGAGKTTLVTYLINKCSAQIFTEDIVIINYLKNEVEPLHRPLYLREFGYELLKKNNIVLDGKVDHVTGYGIDRVRYIPNTIYNANYNCLIDACVLLKLDRNSSKIFSYTDIDSYIYNSYLHTTIEKNIKGSLRLSKNIPLYIMQYYGFDCVYEMLRSL